MVQRVQGHTRPFPRQLRYLLPFRVQVCRVQSPLPCFPSTVLFHGVSLFSSGSHRSGSPPSPILRRRYAILHCMPVAYGFAARLPRFPPWLRAFACALPSDRRRSFWARGISLPASPIPAFSTRTPQDFSGSLSVHPTPMPCSKTPAGSRCPRHQRPSRCCPRIQHNEGSGKHMISWPTRGLSVCCLRFTNGVTAAHARLASGWLARLCREGVEPSEPIRKVSVSTSHPPFQGLS